MSGSWAGGRFGERGECLLAPNPGIMTLDGTNTWVLREPGSSTAVVVDPGPVEDGHLERLDEETGDVGLVLLTHHHLDHSEVAATFAARKGCAVRALDPAHCVGADPLADDEVLSVGGLSLRVVATPGHTADSVSFLLPTERVLLSGDMVLGRGTTVVAHPDGRLGPYFDSIERMRSLATAGEVATIWPAHGPVHDDAGAVLDHYLAHRRDRLAQVAAAVERLRDEGATPTPRAVVEVVYADVDEILWGAAELSVRAQLEYLAERAS
ncbi:MBL fold metallo-hydrolase [Nocardioides dongxiaopingii]|uniref:MBL fold metallo-hydrolase n=1 Tax=Nocardioides sp. S-1144 TaxID=2582905 RepID=UPI0011643E4B|nr:MBL fold metallo-hydrolase [Nocardioides sp. S-1144]QDH10619.1 MBL fold metallo-hydrolase [Nocardioides sp. S-1144]